MFFCLSLFLLLCRPRPRKCVKSLCSYATSGKWRGLTAASNAEGKQKPWKKTHESWLFIFFFLVLLVIVVVVLFILLRFLLLSSCPFSCCSTVLSLGTIFFSREGGVDCRSFFCCCLSIIFLFGNKNPAGTAPIAVASFI